MIIIIWAESGFPGKDCNLPTFSKMHIVRLSDDAQEFKRICVDSVVGEGAVMVEILNDWRNAFDAIDELSHGIEDRVFVFPKSKRKTGFLLINKLLMEHQGYKGCNATRLLSLGVFLNEGGNLQIAEAGIPYLIDLIMERGIDALADEADEEAKVSRAKGKKKKSSPASSNGSGQPTNASGENKTQKYVTRKPPTKAQTMQKQIAAVCEEHGMHAEFTGGTAFITTVAGEWFFAYNDRPIRLHHKNYSDDEMKANRRNDLYHLQDVRFASPLQALRYISKHDLDLRRRVMQDTVGMIAEDRYFFSDEKDNVDVENYYKALKDGLKQMPDTGAQREFSALVDKVFSRGPQDDATDQTALDETVQCDKTGISNLFDRLFKRNRR